MAQISDSKPLKYIGFAIVCAEVPDEISLAFNVSGCIHHCDGCHSQYLWEDRGEDLATDISKIIEKNKDLISCVCFMGGDQNMEELADLCLLIKQNYKLKTCIYSGLDSPIPFAEMISGGILDYLKVGRYMKEFGGLSSEKTNQKIYKITFDENGVSHLNDITFRMKPPKE